MKIEQPFYYVTSVSWKRFLNRELKTGIQIEKDSGFILDRIVVQRDKRLKNFSCTCVLLDGMQVVFRSGTWPLSPPMRFDPGHSILFRWNHSTRLPWWKVWLWFSWQHASAILQGHKIFEGPATPGRDETTEGSN